MFNRKHGDAPKSSPGLSAYENVSDRESQWWRDDGIYMGHEIAEPDDPAHLLRGKWECTGARRNYRQDRHV